MGQAFKDFLITIAVIIGIILTVLGIILGAKWLGEPSPEQRALDAVPRVVAEADGCTVYSFYRNSSWHYFTRCGETVTTTRHYTESCGKGCSRRRTEDIVTQENK